MAHWIARAGLGIARTGLGIARTGLAALVLLAAAPAAAGIAPPPNPYSDAMRRMNPIVRNATLRRVIVEDKNSCRSVTVSAWRGPYKNLQRWEAMCVPDGQYAIFVGIDLSVQVRDCPSLPKLGLPVCTPLPAVEAAAAKKK